MMAQDGRGLLYFPMLNYSAGNLEAVREMLVRPTRCLLSETAARTAARSATRASPRRCSRTGAGIARSASSYPWSG
ncbi:hypothetical protein GS444_10310 [Rhodococcus hoagii]|nr:hypothetical protein [Prescottella equi]